MAIYIVRRALAGAVTLLAISLIVFLLVRATGNPVDLYMDPTATERDRALLTAALGLDRPLYVQYYVFLRGALRGDLGRSISTNRPVLEVFLERFGNTLQLTGLAFGVSLAIALPVGMLAAVTRGKWWDWLARGLVFLGHALPTFWLGIMLMLLFAVQLRWVPPAGKGDLSTFILPVLTISWGSAAGVTRMMRSSMLEVLPADYIRTAHAKGVTPLAVLWGHALKNAMIPVVGFVSVVVLRNLVMGMIVVETVFAWPGVGRLAYQAALSRDFPLVQGIVLMIALVVILATLLADLLYGWLDPRIRYS